MASSFERAVQIPLGRQTLAGSLALPALRDSAQLSSAASGVVLFAHGSGSGRYSPRNQFVARALNEGDLATLLIDLLTIDEAQDRSKVFDLELLAGRLHAAATWLAQEPATRALKLGLFGASTGGGAALLAAARHAEMIHAVVSRGGRPDLAGDALADVRAPTLLIVGGWDEAVLALNQKALAKLTCPKELAVVPGATHLFEEPGALAEVARRATDWFTKYLQH